MRGPHNFISSGPKIVIIRPWWHVLPQWCGCYLLFTRISWFPHIIYRVLSCWVTDDFTIVFLKKRNIPTTIRLNLISDRIIIIYLIINREFMHFYWLNCVEELGCMKCAMTMTGNILSKTLFGVTVRQKAMA